MSLFAVIPVFLAALGGQPTLNSQRSEELVLSADKVVIRSELDKSDRGIVVTDRAWIERFAKTLGQTPLTKPHACFCCGWTTAFFYKDGVLAIRVAAIHGNQLRVYRFSLGDDGDFSVDQEHWNAISQLIREKGANQSVDSTRSAGTSAAEQPRVPASAASHL